MFKKDKSENQTSFEEAIKAYNTSFENAIKKAKQTKDAIPILRMFSVSEKLKDGSTKKRPAKELIDILKDNNQGKNLANIYQDFCDMIFQDLENIDWKDLKEHEEGLNKLCEKANTQIGEDIYDSIFEQAGKNSYTKTWVSNLKTAKSLLEKFKDNLTDEVLEHRKKIKEAVKELLDECKTYNEGMYAIYVSGKMRTVFGILGIEVKVNYKITQAGTPKEKQKELIRIWKKAKKYISLKKYDEVVTAINDAFNKFNNPN